MRDGGGDHGCGYDVEEYGERDVSEVVIKELQTLEHDGGEYDPGKKVYLGGFVEPKHAFFFSDFSKSFPKVGILILL